MLCHLLTFRRLNQDWIKCGQISLFVSVTRKNSDSNNYDVDKHEPKFTDNDHDDDNDDDDDDDDVLHVSTVSFVYVLRPVLIRVNSAGDA